MSSAKKTWETLRNRILLSISSIKTNPPLKRGSPLTVSISLGALAGLGFFIFNEFRKPSADMSSSENKVILKSSDGETFVVDKAVASKMLIIKLLLEDISSNNTIPLPNVTGEILAKVIEYCKEHVRDPEFMDPIVEDELMAFDKEYIKVDQRTLYELILAANYLNVKGLLSLTCQTVADMLKGKTAEEIRKEFNIKYDFSREEEREVTKENTWTFV